MTASSPENVEYKNRQRQGWDDVSRGWEKWWTLFEKGAQVVSDRMVRLASVGPGKRVLDLATGIGEPAVTAARTVGPDGLVIATDFSEEMLAIGKNRAAKIGLENIEFHCLDAEEVDRLDGLFDAVLCRWGLFFLPDLRNSLEKVRHRLLPGGRLVSAVWAEPERVPALSLPIGIAAQILQRQLPSGSGVFSLSDPAALTKIFRDAGFETVQTEELVIAAEFASADEFVQFTRDISAPMRMLIADQLPQKHEEIWDAVAQASGRFAGTGGRISMPLTAVIAVAQ